MKILVTAANGHTGLTAAEELIRLGFKVRAFVRNPKGKGALKLKKMGAEIFVGDLNDYRDVRKSLIGIKRAYYCAPFAPNLLFKSIAFAIAAEESQLEHVVYMSQWLLSNDHHSVSTKEQWLADQIFKKHQKVNYTFINPGLFAFTYFFTVEMIAQMGIMPTAAKGDALNAPPSNEDIGHVAAHILKDPAKHIGKTYRPTGPKLLSQKDIARIFGKILDRPVKIMEISESMLLKSLKANGYPIYDYANVRYYLKDWEQNTFAINGVTNVVKEITGRDAEDFETIARRYLSEMPGAKQNLFNKIKALKNFAKMLITRKPDMLKYEKQQNFPQFMNGMQYAVDNYEWVKNRK